MEAPECCIILHIIDLMQKWLSFISVVWSSFLKLWLWHLNIYEILCYSEKFQCFGLNGCKVMTYSNLRELYGKSHPVLPSLVFMFLAI